MSLLWDAADTGNLEQVTLLVEQGADINQVGGGYEGTALDIAAYKGHLEVVRYLVEQGADIEKTDRRGWTPLINASINGHFEVVRYLLEQGTNRDKASNGGCTPLHLAALHGHLETAKLLMVYGADLNARTNDGQLPIDMGYLNTEAIKQAIRDEPRRRIDEAPGKRATEQDRHPDTATSPSAQGEEVEAEEEQGLKQPAGEGEVADEDQDSEPSKDRLYITIADIVDVNISDSNDHSVAQR